MEIYVEFAFLENFLLDSAILYLALRFSKSKITAKGVVIGGLLGGAFAVAYPLLNELTLYFSKIIKSFFPFLICLGAFKFKVLKNEWGRYALNVVFFYFLSFAFAGGTYGVCSALGIDYAYSDGVFIGAPLGVCFAGFVGVFALVDWCCKAVYERKKMTRFIYPCELKFGGKIIKADGFVDSGNLAFKNGKPVCFVTADLLFELLGGDYSTVLTEELALSTVSGKTKVKIFILDEIKIYCEGKTNIISKPYCGARTLTGTRAYRVLLGAWALD